MSLRYIIIFILIFSANVISAASSHLSFIVKVKKTTTRATMLSQAFGENIHLQPVFSQSKQSKVNTTLSISSQVKFSELEQFYVVTASNSNSSDQIISQIRQYSFVETIEPLRIFHLDTPLNYPNDSLNDKQWALKKIGAEIAWKTSTGKGVLVGVLDTGIDFYHPDLQNNLWVNSAEDINKNGTFEPYYFTENRNGLTGDLNGIDEEGNGFVDDVIGYDFVDQLLVNIGDASVRDAIPYDEQGHGTSVSGIIGAEVNNTIGIAGIAYDCKLVSLRAFDATGNAEEDDIAAAIVYAALNGVRVLNMSFGDVVYSPITRAACQFAESMGVTLVASAGNDGSNLRRFPASYPEVIAVGATNDRDFRASFSSYGSQLALSAPGVGISTTSVGGKYKTNFQGTSAAAPHVAAAAALILENNPSFSPQEVRGVLQASSDDVGDNGWDTDFGSGRLNCATAVSTKGATNIKISFPENDAVFRTDRTKNVEIQGTIATPLFSSWSLWLGKGELPSDTSWIAIGDTSKVQTIGNVLSNLSLTSLQDTTYTLRLIVGLTNGNSIERRVRFDAISTESKLNFVGFYPITISAWHNDKRAAIITSEFTARCRFYVIIKKQGSADIAKTYEDFDHFSRLHSIAFFEKDMIAGVPYDCEVIGIIPGVDTVSTMMTITRPSEVIQQTLFEPKDYSFVTAHLNNSVKNLYGEGDAIAISDRSSGSFGTTKIIQYKNGSMATRDSTTEVWIPRAMGDSNGDGIIEVLAHSLGATSLFQGKSKSDSPFTTSIFSEKDVKYGTTQEFWPATMSDLTGDGVDEIIGFTDTTALAFTYRNGKYELLASAPNDTPRGESGSTNAMRPPNCAVGDFDGDGNIEICYGDTDGDFLVFEYKNGSFSKEYSIVNQEKDGGAEYVASADVDGDGKQEFLVGYYSSPSANYDREYEVPFWTFKLYKSLSANTYRAVWTEQVYGVRAGLEYQSGVSAGDVDRQKGDEIIVAPFPNLYVFKWKDSLKTLVPLWNYSGSYTSSPIIHDFDKNGRNELGFSDGVTTSFWEIPIAKTPSPPINFNATVINATTVRLHWSRSPDADEYAIYKLRNPSQQNFQAEFIGVTSADSLILDTLSNHTLYRFFIRSLKAGIQGVITQPVDAYTHPIVGVSRTMIDGLKIYVHFSGLLSTNLPPFGTFRIVDNNNNELSLLSDIQIGGDSMLIMQLKPLQMSQAIKVIVQPFEDRFGTSTLQGQFTLSLTVPSTKTELYLSKLQVVTSTTLKLEYSEAFASEALSISNYSFLPFGSISAIDSISETEVLITLTEPIQPLGSEYTVTVRNIFARSGNAITSGAGNTLGFTLTNSTAYLPFVFPNPINLSENQSVTFGNLPRNPIVTVYSLDMKVLATLSDNHNDGGISWDGQTIDGIQLRSGVYLFKVKGLSKSGTDVESELVKFAVIR
ncbi:MAG: S8 family serine peptidase [Ignavibacteria bacterium]|nr:S8 family serine peptidase [Ignavibacteria bacterium]